MSLDSDRASPELAAIAGMRILVVDDEPANTTVLGRLLERWGFTSVTCLNDPRNVLETCEAIAPDLVLLDLHMPGLDGFDVMQLLHPWMAERIPLPVLVLTADITAQTKHRAFAAGARDFLSKPFDADEVRLRVSNLLATRRLQAELKDHGDQLEARVRQRTRALEQARLEVVERLAMAAEYRDDSTHEHAKRIGDNSALLAGAMRLPKPTAALIGRAALLHDIGKIAIPDAILLKRGRLSVDEFETVKSHTTIGARILAGSTSRLLKAAQEIAISHHERWDGGGYPNGLAAEAIPISGRIVAVADVFDALVNERPYKPAWPIKRAVREIESLSGQHFDPAAVEAFATLDHPAL